MFSRIGFLVIMTALFAHDRVAGQVVVPFIPADRVKVTVGTVVTFDSNAGLYTYNFSLQSAATSAQEVWLFALQLNGDVLPRITDSAAPLGWSFQIHQGEPMVSWAATLVPDAESLVDDGNVPPSPYQIKPGQTLGGFSFKSDQPPDSLTFFAQGFTKLPQAVDAGDLPEAADMDFTENSASGTARGPKGIVASNLFLGGGRPRVDGFVTFVNSKRRATLTPPVTFAIKFGVRGETVDRSTFRATLNGRDVTSAFHDYTGQADKVAVFSLHSSPLKHGRNVLITTVDGNVPGATRTASDIDRLPFRIK